MPSIDYIIKYKSTKINDNSKSVDTEEWKDNTTERKIYVNNPIKNNVQIHHLYNDNRLSYMYSKYINPSVLPFLGVLAVFGELYVIFKRKEDDE